MIAAACCVAAAVGIGGLSADSGTEFYRLRIELTVTSDWTDVSLRGAQLIVLGWEIVDTGPLVQAGGVSELRVSKPCCRENAVTVSFDAVIAAIQGEQITWEIEKGHIGYTTIAIYVYDGDDEVFVRKYTHRGVYNAEDNVRSFRQNTDELLAAGSPAHFEARLVTDPLVLAFHYPWYGSPAGPSGRWVHWDPVPAGDAVEYASTHVPAAGYYDSMNSETIRRQIREAQAAGIDGFICSWWGIDSFEDNAFARLLPIAAEEGFQATIYYEDALSVSQVVQDVKYILGQYGRSPAFLAVDDRPVIFFYVRVVNRLGDADWEEIFTQLARSGIDLFAVGDGLNSDNVARFDGVHDYGLVTRRLADIEADYAAVSVLSKLEGKLFAATVSPGYDDSAIGRAPQVIDRRDGDLYRDFWQVATASDPDWILITSYNEWHEGTEIEPSLEFGSQYLDLTRELADRWKAQ